jgi:hypothetical protein
MKVDYKVGRRVFFVPLAKNKDDQPKGEYVDVVEVKRSWVKVQRGTWISAWCAYVFKKTNVAYEKKGMRGEYRIGLIFDSIGQYETSHRAAKLYSEIRKAVSGIFVPEKWTLPMLERAADALGIGTVKGIKRRLVDLHKTARKYSVTSPETAKIRDDIAKMSVGLWDSEKDTLFDFGIALAEMTDETLERFEEFMIT